ncbi:AraC family transcriptional regulator [Pseudomonas asturiensis]|uniref:AraC family transcriptional regulator n=1 Tax=Pseudomonas asturiensis TaxID=1190415 RepID=A0A1M7MG39_9PSED|nr:AraC family transcriptional regulator [Pseudomonas asturiensis]SHM89374.1 AraC family transcriptional regulator [Pseudomonas asturiensis]
MKPLERLQSSPPAEPVRHAEAGPWRIELLPPSAYEARYVATQSAVGFAFDGQHGVHAIGSDRVIPFQALANGLAFVPAGCDVFSQSSRGGEYLRVIRTDGKSLAEAGPFNNRIDPPAISLAQHMRNALLRVSVEDDWEAWAFALVERAIGAEPASFQSRPSLTAKRLRLLDDYIEAELQGPVSVQAMATVLGVSEGYLMRAFRDTTGQSPHSYVIDRRLARARTLLRHSTQRLADIAQACGFSSQAHMATAFRQRLGISPRDMRA